MAIPVGIIETIFSQITWLYGFEDCSNYVLFNDNVNISPMNNIQPVTLSLLPLVLFQRKLGNCTKLNFALRTTCTTISFIDGLHHGNKVDETFFMNAHSSDNFKNIAETKHILFLVVPQMKPPVFTPYSGFLVDLYRSNYPTIPFRVNYGFSCAPISKTSSTVLVSKMLEVVFLCRFCKMLDPYGTPNPFVEHPVKCSWAEGCRKEMHEMYMDVTGDGKYVHYYSFGILNTELNLTLDFEGMQTFLKKNPPNIQLIIMTLIKYVPTIHGESSDNQLYSELPWIRSDITVEVALAFKDQEIVQMGRIYYNFLTCHGKNSGLDFYAYINVFDGRTWAVLLICMGFALFGAMRVSRSWLETGNNMIGLLVCTASLSLRSFQDSKIRLFLTVWLLTAFLFTNFYSSVNTATFITPQRINRLKSILETDKGFSIFTFVKSSVSKDQENEDFPISGWETEVGEDAYEWIRSRYPLYSKTFQVDFFSGTITHASNVFNIQMMQKVLNIYHRIRPIFPTEPLNTSLNLFQVVDIIHNCYNSLFVSTSSKINEIEAQIKHSNMSLPIYKGKNEFIPRSFVVSYEKRTGSYLKRQLNYYMSSGQDIFWGKLFEGVPTKVNTDGDNDEEDKPLSLRAFNYVSFS
ncbi:unnamed protein product [Orchesella dallaii]|uniref:Uncharacterized protein n=1 Tax=Orchesella dallaii TaxID=48710 RepID=A0ABP1RK04_9HEXA